MIQTTSTRRLTTFPEMLASLGSILIVTGIVFFFPLIILPFVPEELQYALHFVLPGLLLLCPGLYLTRFRRLRDERIAMNEREGSIVVVAGWLLATLAGAWPICALTGLDFTRGVFESVSGWTTTGLSVVDVTKAPKILLFFRSTIQLAGGAGLAVIMLAAFSLPVGAGLYRAEGRGYQLAAHVVRSSKIVVKLYAGYTVAGIIGLWVCGMSFFDAVNHAFAAVSTGGFSTRVESIGYWNSPAVEVVTMILMLLGNFNFLTAYILFSRKFRWFFKNGEVKLLGFLAVTGATLVFFLAARGVYGSLGKEIRVAVFETVSALTTTGFSTVSYVSWNAASSLVLILLMFVGGGICSTAGGLKQYRVYLLAKAVGWEIKRTLLPRNAVVTNRVTVGAEKFIVESRQILDAGLFAFLYLFTFFIGTIVLALYGIDLRDSLFEVASALGTVGLSVGVTSVSAPDVVLWSETAGMFLGRLEFFVVFTAIGYVVRSLKR